MTSSSHSVPDRFRVLILDADEEPMVGVTEPTWQLSEVRRQHEHLVRGFPASTIQAQIGDDWTNATPNDLARIAAVNALAVAAMLAGNADLPLLDWGLYLDHDGTAALTAHVYGSDVQATIDAFARHFEVEPTIDANYIRVDGVFRDVKVLLSAHKAVISEVAA